MSATAFAIEDIRADENGTPDQQTRAYAAWKPACELPADNANTCVNCANGLLRQHKAAGAMLCGELECATLVDASCRFYDGII